jgi:hypothetical protein
MSRGPSPDGAERPRIEVAGTGAYPSVMTEHHAFDLSTGKELGASDLLLPARQREVAALLDVRLQKEIEQARSRQIGGLPTDCPVDMYEGSFTVENLSDFVLGAKGVTFHYEFGFPHAFLACAPPGTFEMSYRELAPYVLPDGPLARLSHQ